VVSGPIGLVPETDWVPVHPSVATQEVAPVVVHRRVSIPASATIAEVAVSETVGNGSGLTVIGAEALAVPPEPVQVIENEPVPINPVRTMLPDGAKGPDAHRPMHPVALVDDQRKVAEPA
jgi:hypothetical protein